MQCLQGILTHITTHYNNEQSLHLSNNYRQIILLYHTEPTGKIMQLPLCKNTVNNRGVCMHMHTGVIFAFLLV